MNHFRREVRVERAELRWLRMPLVRPFATSFGRFAEEEHLIVVLAGGGARGYGEVAVHAAPLFSHEDTATAWHVLADLLLPRVAGRSFAGAAELLELSRDIRGHQAARAGLEFAYHDLQARLAGEPLWRHYGGAWRPVPAGVSLGIEGSLGALLAQVARHVDEGYRRIKIKIRPGWDVAPVDAVRSRFPEIPFTVDANASYTIEQIQVLRELDRFRLGYIEQPLPWDDLLDHARLQAELATPICLDESVDSPRAARAALALKACRVLNLKPARVGGPTAAREVQELCRRAGVPVWCGGKLETGIGRLHNVALATLPGFSLPGDLSASARYYAEDLVDPPVEAVDGQILPPAGPGLGHEVRQDVLDRVTVRRLSWGQGGEEDQ